MLKAAISGSHAFSFIQNNAGWSSPVARQAHNLKAAGSNPAPATKNSKKPVAQAAGFVVLEVLPMAWRSVHSRISPDRDMHPRTPSKSW